MLLVFSLVLVGFLVGMIAPFYGVVKKVAPSNIPQWLASAKVLGTAIIAMGAAFALTMAGSPLLWMPLVMTGLALSLAGDYFLGVLRPNNFAAGLGAFLIGYILLTLVNLQRISPDYGVWTIALFAAGSILAVTLVALQLWSSLGAMKVPVVAYMAMHALQMTVALSTGNPLVVAAGAGLLISDVVVAWDVFKKPLGEVGSFWALVLYYGGLGAFALSLLSY